MRQLVEALHHDLLAVDLLGLQKDSACSSK
jgi:hypothetical protein